MNDTLKITRHTDDKGYVFVSYSSDDKDTVFGKYILPLQKEFGLRVYCDMDFQNHAIEGWTSQMIENLRDAKVCIIFMSSTYASSYACMLEVLHAIAYEIPIIKVQLEDLQGENGSEEREMSLDTKQEYTRVLNHLQNNKAENISKLIFDISRYIEKGKVSKKQVSKAFCPFLKSISGLVLKENNALEAIKNTIKNEDVFESNVHSKSVEAVTEINKAKLESSASRGINYVLYGEKYTGNHTEIMCNTIKKVLEKHPEFIDKAIEELACLSNIDYSDKNKYDYVPGYFRACNTIDIHGRAVCVGTNLVMDAKLKYVTRLLLLVGENSDALHIEGYELSDMNRKKDSTSGSEEFKEKRNCEKYMISGVRKEGNQASMMWDVFDALAEKYTDKIEKLTAFGFVKLARDVQDANTKMAQPTAFISCKSFTVMGEEYLVAVSYNRPQKIKYIEKMISVCEAPSDFFVIEEE